MPADPALRHTPILLLDAIGFTRLAGVEERRAALRLLQEVLTAQARFFMPFGEVWEKWVRHGTGDGYYLVFDALPAQVALRYALGIGRALEAYPSADLALRVRMVLAVGDVEWVGDQILSDAFAVAERLISFPPFKRYAEERPEPWAVATTRLFHHEIEREPVVGFEEVQDLQWTPFTALDKHGKEHPAYILGPGLEIPAAAAALEQRRPRVAILIGHSLDDPLPEAVELAHHAARAFAEVGRALDLRIDQATTAALVRELQQGCDLLIYYGHGTSEGQLLFADGRRSLAQLEEVPAELWQGLGACFVFACHGERFAAALPCPWLAFTEPILRLSPRPFLHEVVTALGAGQSVRQAVETARAVIAGQSPESGFLDALRTSEEPLPALAFEAGEVVLSRLTPGLADRARVDFAPAGDYGYPGHDPFVGRAATLRSLLDLPSPDLERPLQRVVWVHGDPGMGKSALLRQLAITARDLLFHDPGAPVWVLHLHAHRHTQPEGLLADLSERARELYGLDASPAGAHGLVRALRGRPGRHLWVLDDLTYLDARPEATAARDLVASLAAAAGGEAVPLQLVVSSRRGPPPGVEAVEVLPLDPAEAWLLARMVCHQAGFTPPSPADLELGPARLFHLVRGLTVHYKRSLLLAVESGLGFAAYSDSLEEEGSLEHLDAADLAARMVAHELRQLEALEPRHGFTYRGFLRLYYPLIARAARFTAAELAEWFGDAFRTEGISTPIRTVYRTGLETLTRLNFCWRERSPEGDVYLLPPNQRQVVRALAEPGAALPPAVPLRGAQERLSLALEGVDRGDWEALSDLLEMERDYEAHLADPVAAAAVFTAKLARAELAGRFDPANAAAPHIAAAEEIVELYDRHRADYAKSAVEVEAVVARALFNQGVMLGELDRSEEEIGVYGEVVARYGDRPEAAVAEQVASALVNQGVALGQLGRSENAIGVYGEVVARYGDRPEVALAEQVASALVNQGVLLGQLGQSEEAIKVYREAVARYGDRPEAALAEQVARALVNQGVRLGQLGRSEEELAVYREVVARYGDRPEAALAEQVARALVYEGITLGQLGRSEEELGVYREVVARYGDRPEAALAEQVAKALINQGITLGQLGRSEEELGVYGEVVARYGDRPEAALAERVAKALLGKSAAFSTSGRWKDSLSEAESLLAILEQREPELEKFLILALGLKALAHQELGQIEAAEEAQEQIRRIEG